MEAFSTLLALCAGDSPVTGESPSQRPVTWSFDVFFTLPLNKRLSKQSWGWWFEMPSCSSWSHCNGVFPFNQYDSINSTWLSKIKVTVPSKKLLSFLPAATYILPGGCLLTTKGYYWGPSFQCHMGLSLWLCRPGFPIEYSQTLTSLLPIPLTIFPSNPRFDANWHGYHYSVMIFCTLAVPKMCCDCTDTSKKT